MKIQILSDLHQEFGCNEISFEKADVVIFAGDINLGVKASNGFNLRLQTFL